MTLTRQDIVDFLYEEADLLDEWKLLEWADLFDDEARYTVPPMGTPDADPAKALYYINDNRSRLQERAERLLKKEAHVEYPHSTTTRNLHNIKVYNLNEDEINVKCNFTAHRTKREVVDSFIGKQYYVLIKEGNKLRIRNKKVVLNLDSLRPHGKISIIL